MEAVSIRVAQDHYIAVTLRYAGCVGRAGPGLKYGDQLPDIQVLVYLLLQSAFGDVGYLALHCQNGLNGFITNAVYCVCSMLALDNI